MSLLSWAPMSFSSSLSQYWSLLVCLLCAPRLILFSPLKLGDGLLPLEWSLLHSVLNPSITFFLLATISSHLFFREVISASRSHLSHDPPVFVSWVERPPPSSFFTWLVCSLLIHLILAFLRTFPEPSGWCRSPFSVFSYPIIRHFIPCAVTVNSLVCVPYQATSSLRAWTPPHFLLRVHRSTKNMALLTTNKFSWINKQIVLCAFFSEDLWEKSISYGSDFFLLIILISYLCHSNWLQWRYRKL